jgi:hypothetical protein
MENSTEANTAEIVETPTNTNTTTFELSDTLLKEAKATFKGKKIPVSHELKRPSLKDLEKRDLASPFRSQDVGNETDEVLADLSGKSDTELYDKLVVSTTGYKNNITPDMSSEDREKALKGIPRSHKIPVIQDLTKVSSEVVYDGVDDEVVEFVWSEDQSYRIRTELGSKGQFVVYSTVREPSERQMDLYTGSTKFYLERAKGNSKPVTRIVSSLAPSVALFDEMVESIEGLTVDGKEVDVKNKTHLALVDAYMKRSVIDAVMKETRLDMGE